jgi:1-acyl-sn-glycerol-3-phosphate acyltransferase
LDSFLSTIVAGVRSVLCYATVSLYVLLIGPPALVIARVFGKPGVLYSAGMIGVRIGLALAGIRREGAGLEHLQRDRAAVYCVNHTSNLEPPVIFTFLEPLFPRLGILYKAELRKLPILTTGFDIVGFVPLERGNPEQSMPAIDGAADALRKGMSFLIFPEGTRSRTGQLLPFKKGGFIMAIKAQVPIVPVAVTGARTAMRKGSPIVRPVTVRVAMGPPVETAGFDMSARDRLIGEVRRRIEALLADSREPTAGHRQPIADSR